MPSATPHLDSRLIKFKTELALNMDRRPFEAPTKGRFATYCLLSLASVAIFQFGPFFNANCTMQLLWLAGSCVAIILVYMFNEIVNKWSAAYTRSSLHTLYIATISVVLVFLGQLAIWTQLHLAIPPTGAGSGTLTQACVIHFVMSFYVLSECECYRFYWTSHRHGQPLTLRSLFEAYFAADQDLTFQQSRDCVTYHFLIVPLEFPPRNGWLSRDTLKRHVVDFVVLAGCFYIFGMGILGYPIKRFVNPDLNGDEFPLGDAMCGIISTPTNAFSWVVAVKLQRPIRLLNRMLFWSIVDCVGKVWERR